MKINEHQVCQLNRSDQRSATRPFAGRAIRQLTLTQGQRSLVAQLGTTIALDRRQKLLLQRLQQGDHTPLASRRVRLP